jgi:hypothetical protein
MIPWVAGIKLKNVIHSIPLGYAKYFSFHISTPMEKL